MNHLSTLNPNFLVPPPGLGGRYCAEVSVHALTRTLRTTRWAPSGPPATPPFSSGSARLPSMRRSHSTSPAPVVLAVADFPSAPRGSHPVVGETSPESSAPSLGLATSSVTVPRADHGSTRRRLHLNPRYPLPHPPCSSPRSPPAAARITGPTDRHIEQVVACASRHR